MKKPKHLRPSSLDRFLQCASSVGAIDAPYNPPSEAALLGTAAHEAAEQVAAGAEPDTARPALKHGVDESDVELLADYAKRAWVEIKHLFPEPDMEVAVATKDKKPAIQGTADVVSWDGETLSILDWKSGHGSTAHTNQLLGYALAAVDTFGWPSSGYVTAVEVHLRHHDIFEHEFTPQRLEDFREVIQGQWERIGKQYAPGSACSFCPLQNTCVARKDYVRASVDSIEEVDRRLIKRGPDGLSRDVIGSLWHKAQQLKGAIARYEKVVNTFLEDGDLPVGDGKKLTLKKSKRDSVDAKEALPILREYLSQEEIDEITQLKKTHISKLIDEKSAHSYKTAARNKLFGRLREAGALIGKPFNRRVIVDIIGENK